MSKQNCPIEKPNMLHYYKSIDAYVLVPEPRLFDCKSVKNILEETRDYAKWLEGEVVETIPVKSAKPMTLSQYVPVFRESIIPPEVESDDWLDHLASKSNDPFYKFLYEDVCILDTQFEITEKRKRRYKNKFKKDEFLNVNVWNHGKKVVEGLKIPGPCVGQAYGAWYSYKALFIEHKIDDDLLLTIDDPKDFEIDNIRAITLNATYRDQIPKYSHINAMGSYEGRPSSKYCYPQMDIDGSYGFGVPIVIYTDEPAPYEIELEETKTRDLFISFQKGLREAEKEAGEIIRKTNKKK